MLGGVKDGIFFPYGWFDWNRRLGFDLSGLALRYQYPFLNIVVVLADGAVVQSRSYANPNVTIVAFSSCVNVKSSSLGMKGD